MENKTPQDGSEIEQPNELGDSPPNGLQKPRSIIQIVLPVCEKDFPLVNLWGQQIMKFNSTTDRSLHVLACWKDQFGLDQFCKHMNPFFKEVTLNIVEDVPEDLGWPEASNHLFYHAARMLLWAPHRCSSACRCDWRAERASRVQPCRARTSLRARWCRQSGGQFASALRVLSHGAPLARLSRR